MTSRIMHESPRVVLTGNPLDGFKVVGPFADFEAALNFIETEPQGGSEDMWVTDLHAPATFTDD